MELVLLVLATIILGPPALLIYLGYKHLYLEMSQPNRRDFLIGFFGIILVNALLAGPLYFSNLWVRAFGHQPQIGDFRRFRWLRGSSTARCWGWPSSSVTL